MPDTATSPQGDVPLFLRVPEDLKQAIVERAKEEDRSVNGLANHVLRAYVGGKLERRDSTPRRRRAS